MQPLEVAIIVTMYSPAEPLHDRVDIPPVVVGVSVKVVWLKGEQLRPIGWIAVIASWISPVKPLSAAIVIVELSPYGPANAVTLDGLAGIWKCRTGYATVVGCRNEPLVPRMVTPEASSSPVPGSCAECAAPILLRLGVQ